MAVDREFDVYTWALLFVDRKVIEAEPLIGLPPMPWFQDIWQSAWEFHAHDDWGPAQLSPASPDKPAQREATEPASQLWAAEWPG